MVSKLLQTTWPCTTTNSCRFTYAFYATRKEYFCSALVDAYQMRTFNLTAPSISIIVLHLAALKISHELRLQAERLNVTLRVVKRIPSHSGPYRDVLVKLRIWQMIDFDRVIYIDADSQVLRSLDHLFFLPEAVLAAPRAYWLSQPFFTSILMVITPNEQIFNHLLEKYILDGRPLSNFFDMDH